MPPLFSDELRNRISEVPVAKSTDIPFHFTNNLSSKKRLANNDKD